ncbi:MAG TPA: YidB family protein [Candidatus Limnocylindrales bacterium]|nr:YidB family protein [Candidatus Limnocylindrales bacterium]
MGLLDGLLGNVLGGALGGNRTQSQAQDPLSSILGGLTGGRGGGTGNILLQLALSMLQQQGGLGNVLGKFREAGMGAQADSWVGTGQNVNISPNQLEQVFGSGALNDIASKLGMSQEQAGSAMSQVMPELINQLTPQGQVTADSENSVAEGLDALSASLDR